MAEQINEAYFASGDFEEWFEKKICKIQRKMDYGYVKDVIIEYFKNKIEREEK